MLYCEEHSCTVCIIFIILVCTYNIVDSFYLKNYANAARLNVRKIIPYNVHAYNNMRLILLTLENVEMVKFEIISCKRRLVLCYCRNVVRIG